MPTSERRSTHGSRCVWWKLTRARLALALEDLASNIFEYDVDLALTEFDTLERLAIRLGVSADRWDFLAELVRPR
jgi:hypothetical protein